MVVQTAGELIATAREALNLQPFDVKYVEGFANARRTVVEVRPDLILIDIASWTKNVEELLCEFDTLRSTRSSRKVILASSAKVEDRALALESGADDFLLKPISTREFSARLKATLRSYVSAHSVEEPSLGVLRLRRNEMEVFSARSPKAQSDRIQSPGISNGPSRTGLDARFALGESLAPRQ